MIDEFMSIIGFKAILNIFEPETPNSSKHYSKHIYLGKDDEPGVQPDVCQTCQTCITCQVCMRTDAGDEDED